LKKQKTNFKKEEIMPTVKELKEKAKELNIPGYNKMLKPELMVAVQTINDHEDLHKKVQKDKLSTQPSKKQRKAMKIRATAVFASACVILLVAVGFTLSYLTKPDPSWYEKLFEMF